MNNTLMKELCLMLICFAGQICAAVPIEVFNSVERVLNAETNPNAERWAISRGGYIFRFEYDISGDGVADLFLASSSEMVGGHPAWDVIKGKRSGGYELFKFLGSDGKYSRVAPLALNGIYGLRMGKKNSQFVLIDAWHDKYAVNGQYWGADNYFISREKIRFLQTSGEERGDGDLTGYNTHTIHIEPVYGVLIADLLRNPHVKWRKMDLEDYVPNSEGHWVLREDAYRVSRLVDFTPDLARKWLKTARLGKPPEGDTSAYDSPREIQPLDPLVRDQALSKEPLDDKLAHTDPPPSSVPEREVSSPNFRVSVTPPTASFEANQMDSRSGISDSAILEALRKYPPGAIALVIALGLLGVVYGLIWVFQQMRPKRRVWFETRRN